MSPADKEETYTWAQLLSRDAIRPIYDPQFVPDATTFVIPPGGNQIVDITFTPVSTGPFSATLSITHNPTILVPLTGTGLPAPPGEEPPPARKKGPPLEVPFGGKTLMSLVVLGYGLYTLSRKC